MPWMQCKITVEASSARMEQGVALLARANAESPEIALFARTMADQRRRMLLLSPKAVELAGEALSELWTVCEAPELFEWDLVVGPAEASQRFGLQRPSFRPSSLKPPIIFDGSSASQLDKALVAQCVRADVPRRAKVQLPMGKRRKSAVFSPLQIFDTTRTALAQQPSRPGEARTQEGEVTQLQWQPIVSAPRDRAILLYVPGPPQKRGWIGVGHFELSPESLNDEGYWKAENPLVSATLATHWMPIPAPPT